MPEFRNITGFSELDAKLKELPQRIGKNVLRGMVAAGAAVLRKEIRARAPRYTGPVSQGHPPPGTLKKAVYQKQIAERSGPTEQVFIVGVRAGKRYQAIKRGAGTISLDAYYAYWVDRGHVAPGGVLVPANPFFRDSFAVKQDEMIAAMLDYGNERVQREIDQLGFFR